MNTSRWLSSDLRRWVVRLIALFVWRSVLVTSRRAAFLSCARHCNCQISGYFHSGHCHFYPNLAIEQELKSNACKFKTKKWRIMENFGSFNLKSKFWIDQNGELHQTGSAPETQAESLSKFLSVLFDWTKIRSCSDYIIIWIRVVWEWSHFLVPFKFLYQLSWSSFVELGRIFLQISLHLSDGIERKWPHILIKFRPLLEREKKTFASKAIEL